MVKIRYVCKHGTFSFVGCFICDCDEHGCENDESNLKTFFINGSIGQNIYW